jgi:hypothetical protein
MPIFLLEGINRFSGKRKGYVFCWVRWTNPVLIIAIGPLYHQNNERNNTVREILH